MQAIKTMNALKKLLNFTINRSRYKAELSCTAQYSSFKSSPFVTDIQSSIKYEVSKDPKEWSFVERILPPTVIPKPQEQSDYISEWRPQSVEALNHPYFIKRNKNHMMPVYLSTTYRGQRRLTELKNIEGDIWKLNDDIKVFLQPTSKKPIRTQVHEFAGFIVIHGDHVNAVKYWLQEKKF